MEIGTIRALYTTDSLRWSTHCLMRMQERDISRADVKRCIFSGDIIEDYPTDFPYPSCLVFGYDTTGKILHVVAGTDGDILYMITAYHPEASKFEADFKTRRRR